MAKICDIEALLKTYLVAQGFTTGNIYLQEFPVSLASTATGLYLIRRVGTGQSPLNIDIDTPIVRVWARDPNAHTSYLNQKAVGDLLHGLNPVAVGSSRFLFAQLLSGIERIDDADADVPQHAANYMIRVAV